MKNVCSVQEMTHWVVMKKSNREVKERGGRMTMTDLHYFETLFNANAFS